MCECQSARIAFCIMDGDNEVLRVYACTGSLRQHDHARMLVGVARRLGVAAAFVRAMRCVGIPYRPRNVSVLVPGEARRRVTPAEVR